MLSAILLAGALIGTAPVQLSLNQSGRYYPGDAVEVTVRPGVDGYLLVLHADPDGRVRVLFPLDPGDDAFVRGGRKYELRSRGDRSVAFIADWSHGSGTILAALSPVPLSPGNFAVNAHWDYRTLVLDTEDDETALRDLARQVAPAGIEYDVMPYVIGGGEVVSVGGASTTVSIGVGGCFGCAAWGWGPAWNVGWGWGSPWWNAGFWWGPSWWWSPWWNAGWSWGPAWGWGPSWGWGPAWGWGPGWGSGGWNSPGWPGGGFTPWRSRFETRTWGGQPGAGGIGVQGGFKQARTSNGGLGVGYRQRAGAISSHGQATGRRTYDANGYRVPLRGGDAQPGAGRRSTPSSMGAQVPRAGSGRALPNSGYRGRDTGGGRRGGALGGSGGAMGGSRGATGGSRGTMGGSRGGRMGGGAMGGGGMRGGGYRGR